MQSVNNNNNPDSNEPDQFDVDASDNRNFPNDFSFDPDDYDEQGQPKPPGKKFPLLRIILVITILGALIQLLVPSNKVYAPEIEIGLLANKMVKDNDWGSDKLNLFFYHWNSMDRGQRFELTQQGWFNGFTEALNKTIQRVGRPKARNPNEDDTYKELLNTLAIVITPLQINDTAKDQLALIDNGLKSQADLETEALNKAIAVAIAKAKARAKAKAEQQDNTEGNDQLTVATPATENAESEPESETLDKTNTETKIEEDAQAEIEAKAEAEEARVKAESEARIQANAEARAKDRAKAEAEEEARIKAETEARIKAKAEARAKAKAEAERKAIAEAKAEAETKANAEARAKAKTEAAVKAKAEARARAKAEAEAKEKAVAQAKANAKAKAVAAAKAKEEAKAKEKARVKAEAQAMAEAVARAKAKIEAEAKAKADARIRAEAMAIAQAQAKEEARILAEALARAKAQAKAEAEARAKAEALARAKAKAKAKAREKAEAEEKLWSAKPTGQGQPEHVELLELLYKFTAAYQNNNVDKLGELFAEDARTNTQSGRNNILKEYKKLFSTPGDRHLRIGKLEWKYKDKSARGTGSINLETDYRNHTKESSSGTVKITVRKNRNGVFITHFIKTVHKDK